MKHLGKIVMGLSSLVLLTACQSNQTADSSNEGKTANESRQEEQSTKTLTLSDYLAQGTKKKPLILYYADPSEGLGKETILENIFIVTDGMVTTYEGDLFENLGELAKLSDQEILTEIEKGAYKSGYYVNDRTLELDAPYLDFSQTSTVYDSKYRIFLGTSSDNCYISRLDDQSIKITADKPGTENIEVDPKE